MARFTILDGATTIGGTKLLFETGGGPDATRLLFDFGLNYTTMGKYFEEFLTPRTSAGLTDYLTTGLLPKLKLYRSDLMTLLTDTRPDLAGQLADPGHIDVQPDPAGRSTDPPLINACFITHAHVDHTGSISFLDERVPLYATPVTAAILRAVEETQISSGPENSVTDFIKRPNDGANKHGQRELRSLVFPKSKSPEKPTFPVSPSLPVPFPDSKITEFPDCKITAYPVDHSVPGACAYLIEYEGGKLVYTGDLRFHGRMGHVTEKTVEALAAAHPDVLLIEGTNLKDEDNSTGPFGRRFVCSKEQEVEDTVLKEVRAAIGLVIADFGMKDLDRLMTFRQVARATGRRLAILPRDAYIVRLAQDAGYPTISLEDPEVVLYIKRSGSGIYDARDTARSWARSTILWFAGWPPNADDTVEWSKAAKRLLKEDSCSRVVRAAEITAHQSEYLLSLGYWDVQELCDLRPDPGSLYIHSSAEAFNEEMAWSQERLAEWLKLMSMDSVHIHASGHAPLKDLFRIVKQLAPKRVYPLHSQHRDRYLEQFPGLVHLVYNGQWVEL